MEPPTISDLETVFSSVISSLLALAAIALFVMLTVGGFKRMMAGDDPKAVEGASKTITSAITGLVLLLVSYLVLVLIAEITGASALTTFDIFLN